MFLTNHLLEVDTSSHQGTLLASEVHILMDFIDLMKSTVNQSSSDEDIFWDKRRWSGRLSTSPPLHVQTKRSRGVSESDADERPAQRLRLTSE